jgi:hypothetical protein
MTQRSPIMPARRTARRRSPSSRSSRQERRDRLANADSFTQTPPEGLSRGAWRPWMISPGVYFACGIGVEINPGADVIASEGDHDVSRVGQPHNPKGAHIMIVIPLIRLIRKWMKSRNARQRPSRQAHR